MITTYDERPVVEARGQRSEVRGQTAYLQVVLGVPVRVEDDAGVGGGEVDAQPPRPRAQQEHEAVRVGPREPVDGGLPQVPSHPAVDALVRVPGEVGLGLGVHTPGCSTLNTARYHH